MGMLKSFTRPALAVPNVYETVPLTFGTSSGAMVANQAEGMRISLPWGTMTVTHLGYLCVTSAGNVELLIARPTTEDGLVVDLVATTGMVASSGSSVLQAAALTSPAVLQDGDILLINPTSTPTIRRQTVYATVGALKNRSCLKGSAPNPWSGQVTLTTSAATVPYLVAYGS